jgi:hypothetical protein
MDSVSLFHQQVFALLDNPRPLCPYIYDHWLSDLLFTVFYKETGRYFQGLQRCKPAGF